MIARARGLAVLAYTSLSAPTLIAIQLPAMALTGSGAFSIWLAQRIWAPLGLRLSGVRLEVTQLAPLPEGPAIYASNHESILDVWALFRAIPREVRFLAKQELFEIPVFGWYLRRARFVPVDRRNRARALAALKQAGAMVRGGISLVVFPEGTRSPDGRVLPFKKGPFALAEEAGVPVVPIAITGAAAVVPKGRTEIRPGPIHVTIGAAVHPSEFPDRNALLREVHRRVVEQHRAAGGAGAATGVDAALPDGE